MTVVPEYLRTGGVFVFTSACKGEGKSTTVSSIGKKLTGDGGTVLVIDCDLRGSGFMEPFNGMFGYLYGNKAPEDVLERPRSFAIIYAGPPRRPSGRIFKSKDTLDRFGALIRYARNEYRYVLIDTPPLGFFDDALYIAEFSDGIVLVKNPDRLLSEMDSRLEDRLKMSPVPVVGTLLNRKTD